MQIQMEEKLKSLLNPWYESLEDPAQAQKLVLKEILNGYKQTRYGSKSGKVSSIEDFRESFPIVTFESLKPHIEKVKHGNFNELLAEAPVEWAMTRGTTGESKIVPMTKTDLNQRVVCGPRGLLNFVYRTKRYDILKGYCLNLNFPSVVGQMRVGTNEVNYGYSSGIYAKHNAKKSRLNLVPEQEEIDALGGGITKKDWEKRFDLAYNEAKDKRVTMLIGVTQTTIEMRSTLIKKYGLYPKNRWNMDLLVCTSIAGINTKYKLALKGLYGDVSVVEIYGATEGMYGQQIDDRPFIVPNYDVYFFEVETKKGIKMLYEMKKGEIGSLVVSSCLFPRYKIGDLIKCVDTNYNYYTVIGREKRFAMIKHLFERIFDTF